MTDIRENVKQYIDLDGNLADAIERLSDILLEVPEQYRDKAKIELKSDYDSSSVEASVYYMRPRTAEEQKVYDEAQARYANIRIAREREMYETLKKKFG